MKQVVQSFKDGSIRVEDVPAPVCRPEGILVGTRASLISAGTERMMLKLARKSLLGKARERPDLVRRVLEKFRREGFWATFQSVQQRLDQDVPVGYSAAGEVREVGPQACGFLAGQLVACAGAGFANHAEVNYVPRLLAVPAPQGVTAEAAAYSAVGAIAIQGIRNAGVQFGETVAVLGLGLIGQLAVQILAAAGCRVVGLDVAEDRVALAAAHGAGLALALGGPRVEQAVAEFSRGRGVDAVLITAATRSNQPVELAARLARDRARVVMIGVTGMNVPRNAYYEKELTFIVSRSYGPGRYDPQYEHRGQDYPVGQVRWTEQRNVEAFLDLVATGRVQPEACTTHRFAIGEAVAAFELVMTAREPYLGVVLTYPQADVRRTEPLKIPLRAAGGAQPAARVGVSLLGAGTFARSVLLPIISRMSDVELRGVASASGISAAAAAKKFGFAFCASDENELLGDEHTRCAVIATRHSQHADAVCRALAAGKSVFVEKPLAITLDQLRRVRDALVDHPHGLLVGFNRRFSPLGRELKQCLAGRGPLTVLYRCNAGRLPASHWLADPAEGGRILGEACHFFDFCSWLSGAAVHSVLASPAGASGSDALITMCYTDGSRAQVTYTADGPAAFSKERIEVFCGGTVAVLEDFRLLEIQPDSGRASRHKLVQSDKGHRGELAAWIAAVRCGGAMPIPSQSLLETTLVGLAALRSVQQGRPVAMAEIQDELARPPCTDR